MTWTCYRLDVGDMTGMHVYLTRVFLKHFQISTFALIQKVFPDQAILLMRDASSLTGPSDSAKGCA